MDGVDWEEQFKENGARFYSKAKFKKWYKRGNLDVCDFGVLN